MAGCVVKLIEIWDSAGTSGTYMRVLDLISQCKADVESFGECV